MKTAYDIIQKPVITEASMTATATQKKYTFRVAKDATKIEIARAVEELFKVEVKAVNTVSMKSKSKRMGYHIGKTGEWKKAIVTLTENSKTIEFFDGMM